MTWLRQADDGGQTKPACSNCGQWQDHGRHGYLDCFNECAAKGFVPKVFAHMDADHWRAPKPQPEPLSIPRTYTTKLEFTAIQDFPGATRPIPIPAGTSLEYKSYGNWGGRDMAWFTTKKPIIVRDNSGNPYKIKDFWTSRQELEDAILGIEPKKESPTPSGLSDMTPQDVQVMDPKDRQRKLDQLLDQYNAVQDPQERSQLEERMRSLGWLKR